MPSHPSHVPPVAGPEESAPDRREMMEAIMRDNNRMLFRYTRSLVSSDSEAEDVVQETYLRAFRAMDGFEGRSNMSTWLIRIAINVLHSRRRKNRNLESIEDVDNVVSFSAYTTGTQSPMSTPQPNPEQSAARDQIRRYLETAIQDLPEEFRSVFMLRAVEEFSTEETAAALGIREETVKTRLFRAKRRLRTVLTGDLMLSLQDMHPFAGARCDRIVANVFTLLGDSPG